MTMVSGEEYQTADKHFQRAAYADAARGYLSELLQLAETHFLNLCDPEADLEKRRRRLCYKRTRLWY